VKIHYTRTACKSLNSIHIKGGGRSPFGGRRALYAATKGGIIGLTKSAALQVAAENISINAIASCAFDIPDDMFLRWIDDHHVSRKDAEGWLPIKRLGKPEEIAAATLYLASDEARFLVSTVLTIDGGFTAQ